MAGGISERHEASLDETGKMKRQYLGDSKDAFKWDYLDYLVKNLNMDSKEYKLLVVPMLAEFDDTNHGKSHPSQFLSTKEVQEFCLHLRNKRELKEIKKLPFYTKGNYKVCIHKERFHEEGNWFVNNDSFRRTYFPNISEEGKTVLFLDPDKGLETKCPRNTNEQHVKYCDIKNIYNVAKNDDIIVVFQHALRKHCPFPEHYQEILERLKKKEVKSHTAAMFWSNKVMFVVIGKTKEQINQVYKINESYQKLPRPVEVIRGDAG